MILASLVRPLIAACAAGLVLCGVLTGVAPAQAAPSPGDTLTSPPKIQQLADEAARWSPLSESRTSALREEWGRSGRGPASGVPVDLDRAEGYATEDGLLLRIPFADQTAVLPESNLTVVFDGNGAAVGSSELVLTPRSADAGRVQSWVDGVLRVDRIVDETDVVIAPNASWWTKFSNCLNSVGVASWAITAITIACSAVCVVTVGLGCLACLGAASAVASGTINYCIQIANRT